MWSLAMMVLTSSVLMGTLYFGAIEIQRVAQAQVSQDLSTLLSHQRSLVQYVQACRVNGACSITLQPETELSTLSLQNAGVGGLSNSWKAYWDGKQFLYLYPSDHSAQTALVADLRQSANNSLLVGHAMVSVGTALLNASQTDGRQASLPSFFIEKSGSMVWAVPLPKLASF